MASSERTFGSKLLKARDMLEVVKSFVGFSPPIPEDSPPAFASLLTEIDGANDAETEAEILYARAVTARREIFKKGERSVAKLLSPLRAAVLAQYGKDSPEYVAVMSYVRALRSPAVASASSPSQQSYGSLQRAFSDLVLTLEAFPSFAPSNPSLQTAALKALGVRLEVSQVEVANRFQELSEALARRSSLYAELSRRERRIKAYLLAQYGKDSIEYGRSGGGRFNDPAWIDGWHSRRRGLLSGF